MSTGFGFSNHDSARRVLWKVANRPVVLVCRIGEQGDWSRVTVFKEFLLLFLLGIPRCGQGYRRDDDTWGEEKERRRIRILTHTEGGWEGRRRVSSRRRYLGGREREEKDRDTHPYRGRMGRAKAGIVGSTIPASWIAGLRKWYFQLKK